MFQMIVCLHYFFNGFEGGGMCLGQLQGPYQTEDFEWYWGSTKGLHENSKCSVEKFLHKLSDHEKNLPGDAPFKSSSFIVPSKTPLLTSLFPKEEQKVESSLLYAFLEPI